LTPGTSNSTPGSFARPRLAAELNHPHIARIYDYGETEDRQPYLVMELVHGDPLSRSYHKLSMARALEVVQEVTERWPPLIGGDHPPGHQAGTS
jgi:serine/threonine protein kinase